MTATAGSRTEPSHPAPAATGTLFADVAVPLPLPHPLVYEVPGPFHHLVRPGVRARVPVGARHLVGVVTALRDRPPPDLPVRALEAIVDRAPLLTDELLELASFVAEYYLEPLGEVLRAMLPGDSTPWGERRVWLTDAGALASHEDPAERRVVEALLSGGRLRIAELQKRVAVANLPAAVDRLRARGQVTVAEGHGKAGRRYVDALELAPGPSEKHLEACGRSVPGRAVVAFLARLGRPATVPEILDAVGCRRGVLRRLEGLGVVRRFTQLRSLSLGRHLLRPEAEPPITLRPDQESATASLQAAVREGGYRAFLLQGITSSGKTEVYLRAAETALAAGRSVLLLVPEIALVPALARTARQRFGGRLAILHSGLSPSERQQEWERVRGGEARVVLGPRSAVFAPLSALGLIVVDEEQDTSYKQDSVPRYHGRDVALVRGRSAGATVVLVSATPSLETRRNAEIGKLEHLSLHGRVGQGRLPEGILVDLRRADSASRPGEIAFSERLREEIGVALEAGDQVILLRNRRGYAPMLLCRACGADSRCRDCGLPRTYHRRDGVLLCHYCGSRVPVPAACPECGEHVLEPIGAGTERVEETFQELFPGVPVDVLDRDAVRRSGGAAAVLEGFAHGDTRVLIGTQMVSKGHHFPRVALTAVLLADTYLGFPDFRAVERTYSLLTQLAGRAGRGERPGRVVIQTYHPEHYAIQAALRHEDRVFAAEEMRFRRIFHYPPYTRMIQILARHARADRAAALLGEIAATVARHPAARQVRVSGPAPAPLPRLRGRWRYQLLLRATSGRLLKEILAQAVPRPLAQELVVDVDPHHLL